MEFNNPDITIGYQDIPSRDLLFSLPDGDEDCVICQGEGEVQCSRGESYYYDDCNCVMIKYWKEKGNEFMANGYRKILTNQIRLRNM